MNKETIYIEPSDDITDILGKLKASEKKVVALVPPKKLGVLLSSVNIKLIARTAKAEKKAVVLVTTDDSLTKLAMSAHLPVAPSLKSRPVMPGEVPKEHAEVAPAPSPKASAPDAEDEDADESNSEPADKSAASSAAAPADPAEDAEPSHLIAEIEAEESDAEDSDTTESPKRSTRPAKKSKAKKAPKVYGSPVIAWINENKKWVIFGTIALTFVVVFFVWALMIAPHVKVSVSVRTSSGNFSENVSFSKNAEDEDVSTGVFHVREEKLEKEQTVKFTATGQKDLGEPASGSLVAYTYFKNIGSIPIAAGSKFTYNGFEYVATAAASLDLTGTNNGTLKSSCDNFNDNDFDLLDGGCLVSTTVSVKASAPGEDYNISSKQTSGWSSSVSGVIVYNANPISGGTSKIVTVVQQSDVDLALDKLASETKDTGKDELYRKLSDSVLPIEASFRSEASDPVSSPKVGEEVPEGTTPTVSSKSTFSVLTVDVVRIEEFIQARSKLEEGRKLYSIGEPFIEYFTENEDKTYSAKLKTTYKVGPEISETEILDRISGIKIGRIEPTLKDAFSGISEVKLEKSFFWVNSVPKNPNQLEINVEIEE